MGLARNPNFRHHSEMTYGPPLQTYAHDHLAWQQVQPLLPEVMRVLGDEPAEESWVWGHAFVHLDRYPLAEAAATVIVLHGGGGHGRLLSSAGKLVRNAGLEAVMPDLPGYGLTEAPQRYRRYDIWVDLISDLVRAEHARAHRPVILFGLSMGGMLAWHVAANLPPATLAHVAATNLLDPADREVREAVARYRWVGRHAPTLLQKLPGPLLDVRLPLSVLAKVAGMSNDSKVTRALLADRRGTGSRLALGFLRSWLSYESAVIPESWCHAPVLLAHPGDDRWTPTGLSRRFFDRLPEPKRYVELENAGHLPMEDPGLTTAIVEINRLAATIKPA